jgi:hypothetical protein
MAPPRYPAGCSITFWATPLGADGYRVYRRVVTDAQGHPHDDEELDLELTVPDFVDPLTDLERQLRARTRCSQVEVVLLLADMVLARVTHMVFARRARDYVLAHATQLDRALLGWDCGYVYAVDWADLAARYSPPPDVAQRLMADP